MRWLLLILTLLALVLCFTRHGGGAMAWWLLIAIMSTFATALAFAQARIAGSARDENLSEYDLRRLRECNEPLNHDRSTPEH